MRRGPCPPNCPERRPGTKTRPSCHSDCPRYQAFWNERREANRKNLIDLKVDEFHQTGLRKAIRIRHNIKGRNGG